MTVARTDFSDRELLSWWQSAYDNNRLLRNTFFQSPTWNHGWHRCFVENDARRELLLLRIDDSHGIAAVAPLFLQQRRTAGFAVWRYVLFLADRLAQYTDLVTTRSDVAELWKVVRSWIAAELPDTWIQLHDILPESSAKTAGIHPDEILHGDPYLRLVLEGRDEDSFLQHCAPHMQREISRARRRFEAETDLTWEAVSSPTPALVESLISLNRARFGSASWFEAAQARDFFHSVCARAGSDVLFTVLRHRSAVIHVMCSYVHDSEMLYVLSGMNEDWKRLSPGSMNLDLSIRHALRSGYRGFDFLRGDEAYKREFNPAERRSEHWVLHTGTSARRYRLATGLRRAAGIVQGGGA
ncbi:GNAT family N-acetyltransferase [bacterium]|nr:GNAT family N-acetyltransferase [bacterium]